MRYIGLLCAILPILLVVAAESNGEHKPVPVRNGETDEEHGECVKEQFADKKWKFEDILPILDEVSARLERAVENRKRARWNWMYKNIAFIAFVKYILPYVLSALKKMFVRILKWFREWIKWTGVLKFP